MRRWRDIVGWLGVGCSSICFLGLSFVAAWLPASASGWLHNELLTRTMLLMSLAMFFWGAWGAARMHRRLSPGALALAGALLLLARAWGMFGLAAGWIGLAFLLAAWLWDRRLLRALPPGRNGCEPPTAGMRAVIAAAPFAMAVVLALSAWAHEGHHPATVAGPSPARQQALAQVNAQYQARVKPIFQVKCWDCHSLNTRYPFYYKVPGVRWLIDRDIRQARKHLDMSQDFPFQSHAGPEKDLDAIREVVTEDEMPPLIYRLGHWRSGLRQEERRVILQWAEESKKSLATH